ncbi:MAG: tRNA threonylcarbamoyladenosine dehydratase [Myxococcales bacterium]|nr:tRNA threonylcarbamoyladenosine dehydratase [Myxococcota bacterium]MDW8282313.1 tRNA threonylcarbamoyladenosine dehydratase [Myxococcales bacterium]
MEQTPQSTPESPDPVRLHRRFDRMGRLLGEPAMRRLAQAHVMVVGLGGVGSFAAESLCRSGIGRLTLVDFDRVCVTNTNRQLQALRGTIGKPKAVVLAERLQLVNPQAVIRASVRFYDAATAAALLCEEPDFVVDAIDNITAKCHLLWTCRRLGLRVVSATGAAGRLDPTRLHLADLSETRVDPLAAEVRKILRKKYGFPQQGPFGIRAVYSTERPRPPLPLAGEEETGFRCVCPGGTNDFHSCQQRRLIYGTASFVTGAFGLLCASEVVRELAGPIDPSG